MTVRELLVAVIAITAACASPDGDAPTAESSGAKAPPFEVDVSQVREATSPIACGATLTTDRGGALALIADGGRVVLSERIAEPAIVGDGGRRIVWTEDATAPGSTAIRTTHCGGDGAWSAPRTLVDDGGTPNRFALSPDGARLAFVSTANGLASMWLVTVETGEAVQLTNRGLTRTPGAAPAGFVPVPERAPPRFEGDRLRWASRAGDHAVVLP